MSFQRFSSGRSYRFRLFSSFYRAVGNALKNIDWSRSEEPQPGMKMVGGLNYPVREGKEGSLGGYGVRQGFDKIPGVTDFSK